MCGDPRQVRQIYGTPYGLTDLVGFRLVRFAPGLIPIASKPSFRPISKRREIIKHTSSNLGRLRHARGRRTSLGTSDGVRATFLC